MWRNGFLLVGAIFALSLTFSEAAQLHGANRTHHLGQNHTRRGVCTLEVPTIDLLTPEDRRGPLPKSNGTKHGYSKIDVCCSGWTRSAHTAHYCEPVCEGCENGNCTAPGVCECKRGYVMDEHDNCIPTCPVGCLNGVCTVTGHCDCNAGNVLSKNGKYCLPHCTGGCGMGGVCAGPEYCTCSEGFTLDTKTNKCGHKCEKGCGEGTCVGYNQCACKSGYRNQHSTCVPDCPKGCVNGECVAPNKCSCRPGWTLDAKTGTVCTPHCSQPCLNGDCVAPDTCACKKGYIEAPGSTRSQKCVAHCPGGCPNGICSAPNFCICNSGYIKEAKGSNVCVRRVKRSAVHYELIPEAVLRGW